jgi:ABC-type transporter lipoprotein component MlaA
MRACSVNCKYEASAGLSSRRPGFDPRPLRVRFVVDEAVLRLCFILSTIYCSYQQNEIIVHSKKRTLLEIREHLPEKKYIYIRYFYQRRPDILFTYLHREQQDYDTDCKESEDLAHGVAFYCGVLRCLSGQHMNGLYIMEKLGSYQCYIS